jgi:23S rRNA pseudouridine2457 synthase
MQLILLNKPFGILSQFRPRDGHPGLASCLAAPNCRAAGRLDHDSEGLLLLTDHGRLQARISSPAGHWPKVYLAQVEGAVSDSALVRLRQGVALKDGLARATTAERIATPDDLWPRMPPVRFRAHIPTSWLRVTLVEGRNRQLRRMTAAAGHPTLRLIRCSVGPFALTNLAPGEWRRASAQEIKHAWQFLQSTDAQSAQTPDRYDGDVK